ncbi:MAG: NUDIX hydrolase [Hellea sp.]|nr:NUDIX hydrolase [Hellea sp.]
MSEENKSPIDCVGVVCFKGSDVLLIRRGKPPRMGEWSIPGGRIELGETEREAVLRELNEETNVDAEILGKIEIIDAQFDGEPFRLHDYAAIWTGKNVRAGDDAAHAEFVEMSKIGQLSMWPDTVRIIQKARQLFPAK